MQQPAIPDTQALLLNNVDHNMLGAIAQARIDIVSALHWQTRPEWDLARRHLADDFFFIPLDQSLRVECRGRSEICEIGQCVFVPCGIDHAISYTTPTTQMRVIAIHAHIHDHEGLGFFDQLSQSIMPFPSAWIEPCLQLVHIFNQSANSGNAYGQNLLRQFLSQWSIGGIHFHDRQLYDPRIRKSLHRIHQHYMGDIHVTELAKEIGLGLVQFRKLFKRSVGQSPKIYIAHYRLRQAAILLQQNTDSIKDIAIAVGFQDEHYFHNSFKKFYRCTPNQYRQRIHAEA